MPTQAPLQLAVVGSGPAGCFLSQAILRGLPEVEITILDRLPSPYGLVRYGVAADHQSTKSIIRQFERLFADARVRFAGDVELGRDLSLAELREVFDAVVLATGLEDDRSLGIEGDRLPGVHGAGAITRVLNAHPDEEPGLPELGADVVIIGGGNVAMDLLRFLVKDDAGFEESDIADPAVEAYLARPAERVTVLNRSGPAEAKSDPQMIRELAALPRARYSAPDLERFDPSPFEDDRVARARIAALRELTDAGRPGYPGPEVTLRFGATPMRVIGVDRVEGVEVLVGGAVKVVPASAVMTAIGFQAGSGELAELLANVAETGRIELGLYRTGWAKRGPRGAIPENRSCAKSVTAEILADLAAGRIDAGRHAGYRGLPERVRSRAVSYEQWLNLERHERELAPPGRVRRKLADRGAMVAVARATQSAEEGTPQK